MTITRWRSLGSAGYLCERCGEDTGTGTVLQLDNSSTSGIVTGSGVYYGRTALGAPAGVNIGKVLAP
ncbi:hypothetical protein GCM10009730_29980 [Streptomyces albidochromogenes]|uniref:hypothetical protein n=1 Tax=Streptomyces albidochromogenes TaxID=329524 RepID=UPI00110F72F1|nr:hypothetical protein [Streptomyces albidochromogenes]